MQIQAGLNKFLFPAQICSIIASKAKGPKVAEHLETAPVGGLCRCCIIWWSVSASSCGLWSDIFRTRWTVSLIGHYHWSLCAQLSVRYRLRLTSPLHKAHLIRQFYRGTLPAVVLPQGSMMEMLIRIGESELLIRKLSRKNEPWSILASCGSGTSGSRCDFGDSQSRRQW